MRILIIIFLFLLQSCAPIKEKTPPVKEINPFWKKFEDPKLTALVKESLKSNADILLAMINVSKAQSVAQTSLAERLPQVGIQTSGSRERDSENLSSTFVHNPYNTFTLSAVLNYQIDLWGKMAAANKAAKAELLSAESTRRNVQITVASEVMKAYFNIVALDEKLLINKKLADLANKYYELKLKQFKQGSINNIDLQQAKSQIHQAKSYLILLEQKLLQQENALKILLGRDKMWPIVERSQKIEAIHVPKMPERLPSKLLLQRPDIMAAEHMLASSKHQVDVVRASFFPEISLYNMFGIGSNSLNSLFNTNSKQRSFGANASMPLIDFGKTVNNIDYAKSTESQYLVEYQQTVRVAFSEAIISLNARKKAADNFTQIKNHEDSMMKAYIMTNKRFKAGLIDYFSLIEAEKNALSSKINMVESAEYRLDSIVDMYKAFGGDV